MDRSRAPRRSVAAATVIMVATALGAVITPPAAASAITVTGVSSSSSGQLVVGLPASDARWVEVTVRAADDDPLVVTDDLTFDGAAWTTTAPVRLPVGYPHGRYEVDVDYRLADGILQHWDGAAHAQAGTFPYTRHVDVASAAYDRTSTDWDHRGVTVDGTVTAYDPVTGTSEAVGAGVGVSVRYVIYTPDGVRTPTVSGTTDATGAFGIRLVPGYAISTASATVTGTDTDDDALGARPASLGGVDTKAVRIRQTASPAQVRAHAGRPVTVTGRVQRLTADGWRALSGATVRTTREDTGATLGSGSTDDSGRYSYRVTARRTTTFVTGVPSSPYVEYLPGIPGRVDVPTAGAYSSLRVSMDQYAEVSAGGRLRGTCDLERVVLQYSRTGRSGWTALASTRTSYSDGRSCVFSLQADGRVDGYYRVTHAESNQMLAATSARTRLHRTPTRITGFSTSPKRPSVDSTLTATGTLSQQVSGHWRALRGKVGVVWKPRGDSQYYLMAKGSTTSSGRFAVRAKVHGDGNWAVFYYADATHFYSETAVRNVDAR